MKDIFPDKKHGLVIHVDLCAHVDVIITDDRTIETKDMLLHNIYFFYFMDEFWLRGNMEHNDDTKWHVSPIHKIIDYAVRMFVYRLTSIIVN